MLGRANHQAGRTTNGAYVRCACVHRYIYTHAKRSLGSAEHRKFHASVRNFLVPRSVQIGVNDDDATLKRIKYEVSFFRVRFHFFRVPSYNKQP